MFAAFPAWYGTLLSALYLPVLAVVLTLVLRAAAFEFGGHLPGAWWHRAWNGAIVAGSVVPAAAWGGILAAMRGGLPLGAQGTAQGGAPGLLTPAFLLGAGSMVALCALHGSLFLSLKTEGELRAAARRLVPLLAVPAAGLTIALGLQARGPLDGVAALAVVAAAVLTWAGRDRLAFAAGALSLLAWTAAVFTALYPRLLVSSLGTGYDLTVHATAAGPYALALMSWMALAGLPFVLVYQGWSYWVFRRRLGARAGAA
jgi:cytochrome d ubiquinol oxidase subunit II